MEQPQKFATIDVPGSTSTQALGINGRGEIVGRYDDASGEHGFLLTEGEFTGLRKEIEDLIGLDAYYRIEAETVER